MEGVLIIWDFSLFLLINIKVRNILMGNQLSIQFKNLFKSVPIIIISISVLLYNCNEQSTEPKNDDTSFSFKVKVVDDSNNPLENMKVGSWYHPTNLGLNKIIPLKINEPNASSTIKFRIKENSIVNMEIYDLDNKRVRILIDDDVKQEGAYEIIINATGLIGSIYKCVYTAKDTMNTAILYKDSIYATLLYVNEPNTMMGFTNAAGEFESNNKLYFPSLYVLPELIHTGPVDPTPIGTFTISDTITIMITNTITNITSNYIKTIKNGNNEFTLTYPGSSMLQKNINLSDKRKIDHSGKIIINKLSNTAENWELNQNYPNPFN